MNGSYRPESSINMVNMGKACDSVSKSQSSSEPFTDTDIDQSVRRHIWVQKYPDLSRIQKKYKVIKGCKFSGRSNSLDSVTDCFSDSDKFAKTPFSDVHHVHSI